MQSRCGTGDETSERPVRIPEPFAADTIAREGPSGREWVEALPGRIEGLIERWDLTPDGPVTHGYVGIVAPVLQNGRECVLKVSWLDADSEHEADALIAWDGCGAVRLYDFDRLEGALLLERLDADRTLEALTPEQAIEVAGRLLRRLAIPAPHWARSFDGMAEDLAHTLPRRWEEQGRPFDRSVLRRAERLLGELTPSESHLLVNQDLHYENVLAADREPWLVIDPKVISGDPEYAAAQLLWQRFAGIQTESDLERMLGILVEAAALDDERARGWAYVRIVDCWLWAIEIGLTEDPARCSALAALL